MSTTTRHTPATIAASPIGSLLTWQEAIPFVLCADEVLVNFAVERGGEPSAAAIEVAKAAMLRRARDAIAYAKSAGKEQRVRLNCTRSGSTVWIG